MISSRQPSRSIVLTGFYGCGALDVGRELARRMRRQLIDWDSELERRGRRDLLALFTRGPEPSAQLLSVRTAAELAYRREAVIVLGPEAVELDVWPDLYLENTLSVFIDHPFDLLWQRMGAEPASRDFLEQHDRLKAEARWRSMLPRYEQVSLRLTNPPNPQRQARVILHSFYT